MEDTMEQASHKHEECGEIGDCDATLTRGIDEVWDKSTSSQERLSMAYQMKMHMNI